MTGSVRWGLGVALLALLALAGGCKMRKKDTGTNVAKIVFMDRLDGNSDAKLQLDTIWAELQAAMETWPHVVIERIHMDAEPRQTSKILKLHSVDRLPGLFFLDADGGLIEFAQGDVKANQIREIMLHH